VASGKIGVTNIFLWFCLSSFDSQPSMLANALAWTVDIGAGVTNSSFSYTQSSTVTTAYQNARNNGVIHFAATGNGGGSSISYPSSLSSVNAVGALNSSGNRASFSQYGSGIAYSAPGEGILTTDRTGGDGYEGGDYATLSGTSFASPNAAGVAALVLSMDPSLAPAAVEEVMNETCVDKGASGYDTVYGWGFVNAQNAVEAMIQSGPGDYDGDGDVDETDFAYWAGCMTGPEAGPAPAGCEPFYFDGDDDIDLEDFAGFQQAFTG
jgi:serine protease